MAENPLAMVSIVVKVLTVNFRRKQTLVKVGETPDANNKGQNEQNESNDRYRVVSMYYLYRHREKRTENCKSCSS